MSIAVGARVKVVKIVHDEVQSDEAKAAADFRLGQAGHVTYVNDSVIPAHPVHVEFAKPDAEGDFELAFSEDELEAVE